MARAEAPTLGPYDPTLVNTPATAKLLLSSATPVFRSAATLTDKVVASTLGPYVPMLVKAPPTAIPAPVPLLDFPRSTVNVLLLGSDRAGLGVGRADTIILLSIDKRAGGIIMVSIPRDLYVFIPGDTMGTINTAVSRAREAPDGPMVRMQQTLLYNFGIPTDYVTSVDIGGFVDIVDTLGGIEVPVNCDFSDALLAAPGMDPSNLDNWVEFYIPRGMQLMDGKTAMWYARLRGSTDDWDRSRRQQDVLRAIYRRVMNLDMLPQIPALYDQVRGMVQTNMTVWDLMQFAPLARSLSLERVRSYALRPPYIQRWMGDPHYPAAYLPNPDLLQPRLQELVSEQSFGSQRAPYTVEVVNGTVWDDAVQLAAHNLRLKGFAAILGKGDEEAYASSEVTETMIISYTGNDDDPMLPVLLNLFHLDESQVLARSYTENPVEYRVILGTDFDSCPLTGNGYYPMERPIPILVDDES